MKIRGLFVVCLLAFLALGFAPAPSFRAKPVVIIQPPVTGPVYLHWGQTVYVGQFLADGTFVSTSPAGTVWRGIYTFRHGRLTVHERVYTTSPYTTWSVTLNSSLMGTVTPHQLPVWIVPCP